MTKEYLDQLAALIARLEPISPPESTVEIKHFFSGAAAYVDGRIFMSLTKAGLALKLPEADREQLFRSKLAQRLRYFPKAPIKKQYALFPKRILDDSKSAKKWIERSIAFVLTGGE